MGRAVVIVGSGLANGCLEAEEMSRNSSPTPWRKITVLAVVLTIAGTASAKVIYVDNDCEAGGFGSNWECAYRCLQNALAVANYLADHPKVAWVNYPGMPSNPYYSLVQKYMPNGASGLLAFGVKSGKAGGEKLIAQAEFMSHLANIGDSKTLVIHPSSTTHQQLTEEEQLAAGVTADYVRVSAGTEHIDDIINDFKQALKVSQG